MTDPVTTPATPALTIPEKLKSLSATINGTVFERVQETDCLVNGLLSRRHLCMVGPPGVAKSFLTRTLVKYVGGFGPGDYFEWTIGKFDTPEALFGPHSLKALERDEYLRNPKGKLPVAKLAFISEIWKANSSTLNILLSILNERLFYNNGQPTTVPLACLVADSNETPESASELGALWDRFAYRLFTKPIQDDGNFAAMLHAAAARFAGTVVPVPVITWDEIVQAQQAVSQVTISGDVVDALTTLRQALAKEGIVPSERRFVECLPVIQAQAYRDGRTVADIGDMKLLKHILWDLASQQATVAKLVSELANPLDRLAIAYMEDVEKLATQFDKLMKNSDNIQERNREAIEVYGKLEELSDEVKKLRAQIKNEGRKSDIIAPLCKRVLDLTSKLLAEVFTIDENGGLADPA